MEETITENPLTTFIFGLLEGYWKFEDSYLRQGYHHHPTLTPENWTRVLQSAKFPRVEWRPAADNAHGVFIAWASEREEADDDELSETTHAWLTFDDGTEFTDKLVRKMKQVKREVVILPKPKHFTEEGMRREIELILNKISNNAAKRFEGIIYLWGLTCEEDRDQARVSLPFLTLLQALPKYEKLPQLKLIVVTQGIYSVCKSQVLQPTAGTLPGLMGSAMNENPMLDITHMDLSPTEEPHSQIDEVFHNLWWMEEEEGKGGTLAFRNGSRFVLKLSSGKIQNNNRLSLPNGCQRFKLALPQTRLIPDLEFVSLSPTELEDDEVEIQVKAVALNFRDVFTVLEPIEKFNTIGVDVSGRVTRIGSKVTRRKVGDRILGMNSNRNLALPSHATIPENQTIELPPEMTYAEGSTFPIVFTTAILCLEHLGKIQRGETVLIHTASGGVGLAAIQMLDARHLGATVIATAGSERKRNYLRNLGIQHVFHSRTTDFGKEILRVTEGRGVDLVLNSLTGPGFKEASLQALATNGRFIEMSKLNVWTREEVKQLRPDVVYEIAKIENIDNPAMYTAEVERLLKEDLIKPIRYERFDGVNIRGALTYLQKTEHIGKIVCILPEVRVDKSKVIDSTPLFNEESSYLVTGGLGGIGFEVVKWILENGGKHVAIMSRRQPTADVAATISSWNHSGKHVQAFPVDIGDFDECRRVISHIIASTSAFPPIRGVMHAAGVLQDGLLENQSWDSFGSAYNPKVNGTWNLHDLTKDMLLEHFVLFSSIAATFGSPAQSNHSASNSFEDAFAHFRKSIGLPALTINWANWGEVGVATQVDLSGVRPISTSQGLHALELFLKTQTTQIAVGNVESFGLLSTLFPKLKTYVDDKKLLGLAKSSVITSAEEFWSKVDNASTYDEKVAVFKGFIKSTVRSVLRLSGEEDVADETEFQAIGIDSLMMLEIKNVLQNILGQRIPFTFAQLKDCNTPELLATRLVDILEGEDFSRNIPNLEELKQLIRDDSALAPHVAPSEEMKLKNIEQVEVVLLTGATGNLGPYFLRELSHRYNMKKVYCLIRKRGKYSATSRLESVLRRLEILHEVDMSKVECLEGDITLPLFGLPSELYEELAENVEAVIHSAALVSFSDKYWKAPPSSRNSIRTANVLGTVKILEFAVQQTLKHITFMSSFTAAVSVDGNGHLSENWQDVEAFDDFPENVGYPVSKHICEQLIWRAIAKGVPCKVLRIPFVGGDSRTGRCRFDRSHIHLRLLLFMKMGLMPDVFIPIPIVAVDKCAEICMKLSFDPRASFELIHVCERNPKVEEFIIEVGKEHGVTIDVVTFPEFLEKLKSAEENSVLGHVAEMYQETFVSEKLVSPSLSCLQKYRENGYNFFTNDKICKLLPGFETSLEPAEVVLGRDFEFLKQSGVFKTLGIIQ